MANIIGKIFDTVVDTAAKLKPSKVTHTIQDEAASIAMSGKLADLAEGRVTRETLDGRLTSLRATAESNGLVGAVDRQGKKLSTEQIAGELARGAKVTGPELVALEKDITKSVLSYETKAAKAASGEKTWGDKAKGFLVSGALWGAGLVGLGTWVDTKFNDGKVTTDGVIPHMHEAWREGAKGKAEAAKNEARTNAQQACRSDAGVFGEVTGNCMRTEFGGNFESLQEVFHSKLTREADRVYLTCLGRRLELADGNSPDAKTFATAAKQARLDCQTAMLENKGDIGNPNAATKAPFSGANKPDFEFVDQKVRESLGWSAPAPSRAPGR